VFVELAYVIVSSAFVVRGRSSEYEDLRASIPHSRKRKMLKRRKEGAIEGQTTLKYTPRHWLVVNN
jgi:hypothetical protein